jgi:hypothetical protein
MSRRMFLHLSTVARSETYYEAYRWNRVVRARSPRGGWARLPSVRSALLWGGMLLVQCVWMTAGAWAHSTIKEAQQRYEEADFEGANAALARAEQARDLSRGDVLELLETRALIHFATGADKQLRQDLLRLATLEPSYRLPAAAPPAVHFAFEEAKQKVRNPLTVQVTSMKVVGGWKLLSKVDGDLGNLVRSVLLYSRVGSATPWSFTPKVSMEVPAPNTARVDYYAQVIGPGGSVLATYGTRDIPKQIGGAQDMAPMVARATAGEASQSGVPLQDAPQAEDEKKDGGNSTLWIILGASGVAVAAGIVIYLLASGGKNSDDTQLTPPTINPALP